MPPTTPGDPTMGDPLPDGPLSPTPRAERPMRWLFGGVGVAIGLSLGVGIGLVAPTLIGSIAIGPTPIERAVASCDLPEQRWIEVGDRGRSVTMTGLGEESSGAEYDDVFCVLEALQLPDSVDSRIRTTRALDGRQTGSWKGMEASWSYHPDDGLNIVVEQQRR